jgi:hypothetical protein
LTRLLLATISSLPSSPPPTATAEDGLDQSQQQPGSPAFSTSSTFEEGGSSPVLPPLPAPTFSGRTLETLNTPTSPVAAPKTDGSHYYTASWGSPYQQPQPSAFSRTGTNRQTLGSDPSDGSPVRHLDFHTPFLRPTPTFTSLQPEPDFVSNDGLISAAVLANRARRPAQGLTEDWIRQHIGGELAERNSWLSDGPGDSEHSSLSGSISGDGDWLEHDPDPKTPTLKDFLQSRDIRRNQATKRSQRKNSTATLTQAGYSDSAQPTMSTAEHGKPGDQMGNGNSAQLEDGAPPVPPKELPEWRAEDHLVANARPPSVPTPAATPAPPPRFKKKVPWKGKNIMVLLPRDDERGRSGKAPAPMTENEVKGMLAKWEDAGYDTAGFNLGQSEVVEEDGSQGQSRSVWPLAADMERSRKEGSFRVSIPDRGGKLYYFYSLFTKRWKLHLRQYPGLLRRIWILIF